MQVKRRRFIIPIFLLGFLSLISYLLIWQSHSSKEYKNFTKAALVSNSILAEAKQPQWQMASANLSTLHCPEYYKTTEEKTEALNNFVKDFYMSKMDATGDELVAARMDFYILNHCLTELQFYGYGNVGLITPEIRLQLIETMRGDIMSTN